MRSGPWGHDREWERGVVEQIRAGGAAPAAISLYDSVPDADYESVGVNAGGWEYAEARSKNAIRTGAAYLDDASIAKRAAQRKLLREAQAEATARFTKAAKQAAATRLAQDEADRQWRAEQQKREQRERERNDAWAQETQRHMEAVRVLSSKWSCTICNGMSVIESRDDGYQLTCLKCGKTAWGSHGSLTRVLNQQPVDSSQ